MKYGVRSKGTGYALAGRGIEVCDDNFEAFAVEVGCDCFADAGAGACHNGYWFRHVVCLLIASAFSRLEVDGALQDQCSSS